MLKNLISISSPSSKTASLGLHAVNGIISANVFIYIAALFLTSYPASWIPYFFIGRTILEIITSFLVTPFLAKKIVRNSLLFQGGSAILTLLAASALSMNWYFFPLVLSLLLTLVSLISGLIAWNSVRNAFDLIEFKEISPTLPIAAVIGKIVISLGNTVLIKHFGIAYLPYLTAALLLISCVFIFALKPLPIVIHKSKHGRLPIKYPLFVNLFLFSFILAFGYTLVDYTLRTQLASAYDSQQIGQFMSVFSAITYFLSSFVTYFFTKRLMKMGATRLLQVLPLYWTIIPFIVIFFPNMRMIAMMGSGDYIFYNFINVGRAVLLNVLPNEIRAIGQMAIQVVSESAGIGFASLFLIIIAKHVTIPLLAVIIIFINLFLLFYSRRLQKDYVTTLSEEIFLKRFTMSEGNSDAHEKIIAENVLHYLNSPDLNSIRFGYSLLSTINMETFPAIILQHIHFEAHDIRIEAIKAIIQFNEKSATSALFELFKKEQDPEVKWWIINALAEFNPQQFIEPAHAWLQDATPEVNAGAIRLLFLSENSQDIELAKTKLYTMLQQPNIALRRIAARVITKIPLLQIKDHLATIINDADDIVSSYAIDTIYTHRQLEFAPVVVARLAKGGIYFSARKFLAQLGDDAIPLLMKNILENKNNSQSRNDILVAALAQIMNEKVEHCLVELAEQQIVSLRQIVAIESITRARHFRPSDFFTQKTLQFARADAELILALRIALQKYTAPHIANELIARKYLAVERYLCWIGVDDTSAEVFGLIPTVLQGLKSEQAKGIELLSSITSSRGLTDITATVLTNHDTNAKLHLTKPFEEYFDSWLKLVINTPLSNAPGLPMNNMQKVFVLRQVELFKHLPAEVLMIIAEEAELLSMPANLPVFSENDPPTGLYIIVAGNVKIIRQGNLLSELKENDFFGELALIDNAPRAGTALATSEGTLLFLNRDTFERITNDLPQVLRSVTQTVLRYLRTSLAKQLSRDPKN